MDDFKFEHIAPRCGGESEAFEELCCQLARKTIPDASRFIRLRGAGGDGGVECFYKGPDGNVEGWQAKYLFNIDDLLSQATNSLTTALEVHKNLNRYVLCFPFNLTGQTKRRGRSNLEKYEHWRDKHIQNATSKDRELSIDIWPASELRRLLLDFDRSGGIREFFFNKTILTPGWFASHINTAIATAGPRYTPVLSVQTGLAKSFAAFGRTAVWFQMLDEHIGKCRKAHTAYHSAINNPNTDTVFPSWPDELLGTAQSLADKVSTTIDEIDNLKCAQEVPAIKLLEIQLTSILRPLSAMERKLSHDLEAKYGPGRADSPGFRQFKAEFEVSFPAANLDCVRELIETLQNILAWFQSPACYLAFEPVFILSGGQGTGKTHAVCDIANQRLSDGLLSCIAFGHEFSGNPDPWTRFTEILRLPLTIGADGLLDALNSASEAANSKTILFVDAINETRPLDYWHQRFSAIVDAVKNRPNLRLCITCRTPFLTYCVPEGNVSPIVEHTGFTGVEREACIAFFSYYKLKPPIMPIIQSELRNPLYLKLACETLQARGQDRFPSSWFGLIPVIIAFLEEKERSFAAEFGTDSGANIVGGSLQAIAKAIAEADTSSLPWSRALAEIRIKRPQAINFPILEWLKRADLIMEDAPIDAGLYGGEISVRPAFERLGDFLVANEIIKGVPPTGIEIACHPGGTIYPFIEKSASTGQTIGIISALSILIPENFQGTELPILIEDKAIRKTILRITIESFPWRDSNSLSDSARSIIIEGLGEDFSYLTMDAILSIAWQPSSIDAIWISELLGQKPMAKRDSYWCSYLHDAYEHEASPVLHLINASFELPLDQIDQDIAERWATLLIWFTAAADRRIKDRASRAVINLLTACPTIMPTIFSLFLYSNDDEVKERMLLSYYGALINSRNTEILCKIIDILQDTSVSKPLLFDNALIRDHCRCIYDLAAKLGIAPEKYDPLLSMKPIDSEWPIRIPSDGEIKQWEDLPKLEESCLHDDFYIYSMGCLKNWMYSISKYDMGKWILQRVAVDLGYAGSGCEEYDLCMLGNYGGGRGREMWADRIGKKYQWIALYNLASRLYDHVERKRESWDSEPSRNHLILPEERKMDPTLPYDISISANKADAWWIRSAANLDTYKELPDNEWVIRSDDLPKLNDLLTAFEHDDQRWQLLSSYLSWNNRGDDEGYDKPYRDIWIHIESYLVPKQKVSTIYNCLNRRNFFGRWMPEGVTYISDFAGEYPWAIPIDTETDEQHIDEGDQNDLLAHCIPSYNKMAVEWEYDASLPHHFHFLLPARDFFSPGDLWWDGRNGYRLIDGKTVFRDPSITEGGSSSLIADIDELVIRLDKLGLSLIWTVLGEKWILGGSHKDKSPRCTFSQTALMLEDGSTEIGELILFDNYDKDTGIALQDTKEGNNNAYAA